jgi:hypothetical protein
MVSSMFGRCARKRLFFVLFIFAEDLQHEPLSGSVGDIGGKEKTQAEDEG